jgi:hypothetical protein
MWFNPPSIAVDLLIADVTGMTKRRMVADHIQQIGFWMEACNIITSSIHNARKAFWVHSDHACVVNDWVATSGLRPGTGILSQNASETERVADQGQSVHATKNQNLPN